MYRHFSDRTALCPVMTSHGYPNVQVHEYPGFSRPLLVGIPERIAGAAPRHAEPVSIAL